MSKRYYNMVNHSTSQRIMRTLLTAFMCLGLAVAAPQFVLANEYGFEKAMDDIESGNLRKGIRRLYKIAQKDYPPAQFQMGVLYDEGVGFRKNPRAAGRWYRKAADQGHMTAQYELAIMLDTGQGQDKHLVEAYEYYQKAAEQGHPEAKVNMESLKSIIQKQIRIVRVEESNLLRDANAESEVEAKLMKKREVIEIKREGSWIFVNLFDATVKQGWILDGDLTPLADAELVGLAEYRARNFKEAYLVWKPLALEGHIPTMYRLGRLFENGQGVKRNYGTAAMWYLRAANKDHIPSMSALAGLYRDGRGMQKDKIQALRWYKKAAAAGNVDAKSALADMYFEGDGIPNDHQNSLDYYLSAARRGLVAAQCKVAEFYAKGIGTKPDVISAYAWSKIAALQGHEIGQEMQNDFQTSLADWQIKKGHKLSQKLFKLYVE